LRPGNPFVLVLAAVTTITLSLAGCGSPGDDAGGAPDVDLIRQAETVGRAITGELLESTIADLASDEMAGRGPGSDGDRMAQRYLIDRMTELGFEPAGEDGGWLQPFDIVGITASAPATWSFETAAGTVDLAWWDETIAGSGVQQAEAAIEDAEMVFVGYGIEAPEYDWDDFGEADLTGKVLLMLNNDPDWDPELFEGDRRLYYGRWTYKYEIAAARGAAGAIIIHTTPSAGYPWQVVQTSWTGEQFEIPAGEEPRTQINAWITDTAARRLLSEAGHDLDRLTEAAREREFEPVPLGIRTSFRLTNEVRTVETANVLGRIPGRDPELADEYVVFSAHHDHLGIGRPNDAGDEIYNGALDNASGVAQVLAIGQALAELPVAPRRSILFAFVAAEEQGLLGSAWFAQNPTVAPGRIAANINYDGANIWGRTRDVTFVGFAKSSLGAVVEKFAAAQGRTVKPDQFPDKGSYYRSDQFNFAKIGVPAIYLGTGTEFVGRSEGWGKEQIDGWVATHYHQPSDELIDEWTFEGMIDDSLLGLMCAIEIAESDELPTWSPGDEFEAARLAALAAVAAGDA
jgi:Zn-dependent M28 family amino/carboxypeptidase